MNIYHSSVLVSPSSPLKCEQTPQIISSDVRLLSYFLLCLSALLMEYVCLSHSSQTVSTSFKLASSSSARNCVLGRLLPPLDIWSRGGGVKVICVLIRRYRSLPACVCVSISRPLCGSTLCNADTGEGVK